MVDEQERQDQPPDPGEIVERAARAVGAAPGSSWREVRLGRETLRAELAGRRFERPQDLGRFVLRGALLERVERERDGAEPELREAIAGARRDALALAEEELRATIESIEPLIAELPAEQRPDLVEESIGVLADEHRSERKLRKRIRQFLLVLRIQERAAQVADALPGLRVVELRGGVVFEMDRHVTIRLLDDLEVGVPVRAESAGGELEELFLLGELGDFVAAARRELQDGLDRAEEDWRRAAEQIETFVAERARRRFYDRERLTHVVVEELEHTAGRPPAQVLHAIRSRTRRLDSMARERETVWRLVREHNLFAYKDAFPVARTLGRRLVLYVGPTNSGKTWHALNDLAEARTGVYLAPLRLLALEGQDEVEKRGRICSYITGEERLIREDADFIASTIEMLDPTREVETAVIDEVQLLADEDRGWAWCQALVGAPAKNVVMTGSPDAVPLVQALAEYLGEPLEVRRLERFTPLLPMDSPSRLSDVTPGTALIAFSRREVLRLKAMLSDRHQVAVIYGNLTPEVRREEARRFRSGEAQVLVATDAIAMGLNLPIRTVLFSTLRKWNGREEVDLSESQMLQIGGRAGRFGKYEEGRVGALDRSDLSRVRSVFRGPLEPPPLRLGTLVRPLGVHIDVIADGIETDSLKKALVTFQRGMTFDSPLLSPGVTDDMIALAEVVDSAPEVPLAERLTLSCAPVDASNEYMVLRYERWVDAFAAGRPSRLPRLPGGFAGRERASTDQELHQAEMEAKGLTVYAWLAYRWPALFPDLDECQAQRAELDGFIERSLARQAVRRACRQCGQPLPGRSRHATCAECHRRGGGSKRGGRKGGRRAGGGRR